MLSQYAVFNHFVSLAGHGRFSPGKDFPLAKKASHTSIRTAACDLPCMKSSTKDKIKGALDEAKGKLKEKTGRATRDEQLRNRGTAEKIGGKVRRKLGDIKKVFGA